MGEQKAYKVLSAILHNHKRYEEGSTIELVAEEAKALIAAGAINGDGTEGVSSGVSAETILAAAKKQIKDLQDDVSAALEANKKLIDENEELKKQNAELTGQVEALSMAKGKGKK